MRLSDDILLLLLDDLSLKPADLVSFALANRRVHGVAHTHLAEHQSLIREFTIVCLDALCTHEKGCGFFCGDPVDLVEFCKPGLRIFEYIKCVNLGFGARRFMDSVTMTNWQADTIAKVKKNEYVNSIYEGVIEGTLFLTANRFLHPAIMESLFLWQLSRPTVIRVPTTNRLLSCLSIATSTATECNIQGPISSIHHWKHLIISVGEQRLDSGYLNHTADNTMHLVVVCEATQNLLTLIRFWSALQNMCQVHLCSFERIIVDFGHLPADNDPIDSEIYWRHLPPFSTVAVPTLVYAVSSIGKVPNCNKYFSVAFSRRRSSTQIFLIQSA